MKINFKQPKFVLPLIILPFLFILFFVFNGKGKKGRADISGADSLGAPGNKGLNPNMPGVSGDVSGDSIKDKFAAYQQAYKNRDGTETAMQYDPLEIPGPGPGLNEGTYSQEEIQRIHAQKTLDSLQRALRQGSASIDRQMQALSTHGTPGQTVRGFSHNSPNENDALLRQIRRMQEPAYANSATERPQEVNRPTEYERQMKLFRDQMGLVDSLQKNAGTTGEGSVAGRRTKTSGAGFDPEKLDPEKNNPEKPLPLSTAVRQAGRFNTLRHFSEDRGVPAMVDQDIQATLGSRVRIRLLQDIYIGGNLIAKGSYLYGVVTGFQSQRINIGIAQVLYEGTPLPVKLDLFDSDGYLGLYVPGSNFREFTKEIGTQGTQGLSQVNTSDGSNVTTGLLQSLFSTTSTTLSKLVRQDKARLKYNYIVYLKENIH